MDELTDTTCNKLITTEWCDKGSNMETPTEFS